MKKVTSPLSSGILVALVVSIACTARATTIQELRDSMIAGFTFEDTSDLEDITGNGHDGVNHGAVSTPGKFGNAYEFDGLDDWATITNLNMSGWKAFTVTLWLKTDFTGYVSKYPLKLAGGEVYLRYWENEAGTTATYYSCVVGIYVARHDVDSSRDWRHVALTYKIGTDPHTVAWAIWLDGVEVSFGMEEYAPITSSDATGIVGAWDAGGSSALNGAIDELGIWNTVLDETELDLIRTEGLVPEPLTCTMVLLGGLGIAGETFTKRRKDRKSRHARPPE